MALRFQAHGGVYIAGGVAAKLASRLTRAADGAGAGGRLLAAYLGKGHSTQAYSGCPLYVCTVSGDELGLEGVWRFAQSDACGFRSHAQ